MRINPPTTVARREVDELITGLWSFANALGLLTDDVGERTGGAGVTVDGMLIRDGGVPQGVITAHEAALSILESQIVDGTLLGRLAADEIVTGEWTLDGVQLKDGVVRMFGRPTAGDSVLLADVVGDSQRRFLLRADGLHEWGPGNAARDVNLYRSAANILATDDEFRCFGTLNARDIFKVSRQDTVIVARTDDFDLDGKTIQQFLPTGNQDITGFAGGVDGRIVCVRNSSSGALVTLKDQDANSVAANRFSLDLDSDFVIVDGAAKMLAYNATASRWQPIA